MESSAVVRSLAALAQASRLQIFKAMVQAGPAGLTPGDLSERLGVAANTLSFHLKELMHAELVTQERAGRRLIYRAEFGRMWSDFGRAPLAGDDSRGILERLGDRTRTDRSARGQRRGGCAMGRRSRRHQCVFLHSHRGMAAV